MNALQNNSYPLFGRLNPSKIGRIMVDFEQKLDINMLIN